MSGPFSKEADYVVLRPAANQPPGYHFPDHWNGRWLDRSDMPEPPPPGWKPPPGVVMSSVTFVPTGRFEVRDYDGAVAEVWEPIHGDEPTA